MKIGSDIRVLGIMMLLLTWLSPVAAQSLKVMSYNIHIGQNSSNEDRLQEIGEFIHKSGADLVALQEVDSMCVRSGRLDQMQRLAQITGMYYTFVRHFAFDGGAYGQGILSRYPIDTVQNLRIPILSDGNETRAALSAAIRI